MTRDTDDAAMTPLQRLIDEQMKRKGWDRPAVEARGISHSTLHAYITGALPGDGVPRRSTMKQLAKALDLGYPEIEEAALKSRRSTARGETVAPAVEDEELIRAKRPPGVSEEEWQWRLREARRMLGLEEA